MIKVICTDLDGTLLRSDKTISAHSLSVLSKLISQGLEVVPVTGRHLGGIPQKILDLGVNYAICANGAALYDVKNNKALKTEPIENKILAETVSLCEKYDIMSDIFSDTYAYTDERCLDILKDVNASAAVKDYIRSSRMIVPSISEFISQKKPIVQKITMNFRYVNGIYKNRDKMAEYLKNMESLASVTGGANNIEVTSSDATKGKCIEFLSNHLSIPLSEFFAVGDTENDISMLKAVENSCAMQNASDDIKKICKYVTDKDNDNDGAADMMIKIAGGII